MRRVVTTTEEETETQLMKRLSDTYDVEQLVDKEPPKTTTTPATKPKRKRPIIDSSSDSDSDTETKMTAIRQMMKSPPVQRHAEDIADRVKTRPRKTATGPKMTEPVAEIVVEGDQLKMKSTYLRPRIVQPGYTVQVPGILWEFSADAPVPN